MNLSFLWIVLSLSPGSIAVAVSGYNPAGLGKGLEDSLSYSEQDERFLQATYLNSCNTESGDQQCCTSGPRVCSDVGEDFEVDTGSCLTYQACKDAAKNSGSAKIGKYSCHGGDSCVKIGRDGGYVVIKDSACLAGAYNCHDAGSEGGNAFIGDGACVSTSDKSCSQTNACSFIGMRGGNATVLKNSCIGSHSCHQAGMGGNFFSDNGSCIGGCNSYSGSHQKFDGPCQVAGGAPQGADPSKTSVTIAKNSCIGMQACQYAAYDGGNVKIGSNSCLGHYSCIDIGHGSGNVVVHDNACLDRGIDGQDLHACSGVGQHDSGGGSVIIKKGACIGSYVCQGVGYSHANERFSSTITIGESSCKGNQSCYSLGRFGGFVLIGDNSCINEGDQPWACAFGGGFGTHFKVGTGSCKGGSKACHNIAGNIDIDINTIVGDNSCIGIKACSFSNYNIPGNFTIGMNACKCDYCCQCVVVGTIIPDSKCNSLGSGPDHCCIDRNTFNSNFEAFGPITLPNAPLATTSPSVTSSSPPSTPLATTSPSVTSSSPPSTLIDTIKKYTIILDKSSFDSSQFMLTTEHTTSDLSGESQIKMSIMTFDCNATYGGIGLGKTVTDSKPVVLIENTSLVGTLLSNTFQVEKFALENSVLTSTVSNSDKSIAGKLKFCVKAEIIIGATSVNFRESNIELDYDLSSNSFSITENEIKKENIITSEESAGNIYSIEACRCMASSHECLSQSESSQTLNQDSLVSICLQPNSTDVKISEINMKFFHHELSEVFFETVTNSTGIPGLSIISGSGTVSDPFKITSRLISGLFDNGARKFDIKGTANMQFHSSTRNLNLRSGDRVLQQEEIDGESASYQMSVDIKRLEIVGSEYDLAVSTPVVAGFLVLVLSIAAIIYKKVS